ncbi:MAG: DUF5696 domain-containing protein [Clostridiales bacterium]|nr:DUF5696 domain-containing protein [Clostridiales bacterium]
MRSFSKTVLLIISLALTIFVFSGCSRVTLSDFTSVPEAGTGGTPITQSGIAAENGKFSLWVDTEKAAFEIRSATGTVWRSLPENFDNTEWVNSMLAGNLASILSVTALDTGLASQVLPCYEMCVKNGTVTYEKIENGARFIFRYEAQGITVPLDIVLSETGFTASVSPGDVVEDGGFLVNQFLILPYFNSGSSDDDGFVFYPDGSGAISDYKKDYNNSADIIQAVYGFDRGIGAVETVTKAKGYRMPVFAAKTGSASYLAVIRDECAFVASVNTGVSRNNNRYFKNGAAFTFRDVGKVYLRENSTTVNTSYTIPAPVTSTFKLETDYILMEGADITYADMANTYRAYLEQKGVFGAFNASKSSMHLTLTGALIKRGSFLGIPVNRLLTLTTFDQANEILAQLKTAGYSNISVRYTGAHKNGIYSGWTRDFALESSLGGASKWNSLVANNPDSKIFLEGQLFQIYRNGNGYSVSDYAARTTGNGINFQQSYFIIDGTRDGASTKWTLLSPAAWADAFAGFGESAGKLSKNLSVEDAGGMVYSEYNQKYPAFRDLTGPALTGYLKGIADSSDNFALTDGYAYTWGIADTLYSVPLGASGYFIQSGEVPFYQMAVHGYIEYSGEPMNEAADKLLHFLRSVEYGALPHYSGIYADSSETIRTQLEKLFSANFMDWMQDAEEQAHLAAGIFEKIAGARIVNHETVSENVYRTTFENGVSVIVDYNSRMFTAEGVQ